MKKSDDTPIWIRSMRVASNHDLDNLPEQPVIPDGLSHPHEVLLVVLSKHYGVDFAQREALERLLNQLLRKQPEVLPIHSDPFHVVMKHRGLKTLYQALMHVLVSEARAIIAAWEADVGGSAGSCVQ